MRPNQTTDERRGLRALVASLLLIVIAGFGGVAALAQPAPSPGASENRIEADAINLRNSSGSFRCALFNAAKGFPKTDESKVGGSVVKVTDGHATCVFKDKPPGNYAVVAMHDENDNGKMDYNFIGMPIEGYGFSNDPHVLLAPRFDAAKVQYSGGVLKVPIRLRY